MFHRLASSWDLYISSCRRHCAWAWTGYLFDTLENLPSILCWARQRKESCYRLSGQALFDALASECALWPGGQATPEAVLKLVMGTDFTRALNPAEARRLWLYRNLCLEKPEAVGSTRFLLCLVGQEPGPHTQMCYIGVMNTIIKSSSICWADGEHRRPMSWRELLAAQGFVTSPHLTCHGLSSSFLTARPRSARHVLQQAGNAMPVQMVGMALLFMAIAVERTPVSRESCAMSTSLSLSTTKRPRLA